MSPDFFARNRDNLAHAVSGGLIVVTAYKALQRGADAAHDFEQEANFWYLSGIEEPDWWLIIDGTRRKSWLVPPQVDDVQQIFEGSLAGEQARRISGIDEVIDRDEASRMLREAAVSRQIVYTAEQPSAILKHAHFVPNPAQTELSHWLGRIFKDVRDCGRELAELRTTKQPEEITAIKKAIATSVKGFQAVRESLSSLKYEYEVEALLSYEFRKRGATGHAYSPIVACAGNACTLHYNANTDKLKKSTLLLIDVGARQSGYAADITRTYALGTPTRRQIEVHNAVRQVYDRSLELYRPGMELKELQEKSDEYMIEALQSLGLYANQDDLRRYFPHALGHGLGIDVHDPLKGHSALRANMVLTLEPGIYIPEENIGVRLEDDILITDDDHEVLSRTLPLGY